MEAEEGRLPLLAARQLQARQETAEMQSEQTSPLANSASRSDLLQSLHEKVASNENALMKLVFQGSRPDSSIAICV